MNITHTLRYLIAVSALLSGCHKPEGTHKASNTEGAFDLAEVESIIREQTDIFTAAHITKDTAFLNNIVTDDARCYPPNSAAVVGKKAISQLNTDWVNYGIHEFRETSVAFYGRGEYVVDEGTYFLSYGTDHVIDSGKYINIWKKVDGDWKIYSNIWNTSLPLNLPE